MHEWDKEWEAIHSIRMLWKERITTTRTRFKTQNSKRNDRAEAIKCMIQKKTTKNKLTNLCYKKCLKILTCIKAHDKLDNIEEKKTTRNHSQNLNVIVYVCSQYIKWWFCRPALIYITTSRKLCHTISLDWSHNQFLLPPSND